MPIKNKSIVNLDFGFFLTASQASSMTELACIPSKIINELGCMESINLTAFEKTDPFELEAPKKIKSVAPSIEVLKFDPSHDT